MNIASNTKRSGRAVRRADRIRHHVNYLPELDRGIPYLDLMTPEQVERIHDASMNILETKGIVFRDDEALDMWRAAGAKVVNETVYLDRAHLMQLILQRHEQAFDVRHEVDAERALLRLQKDAVDAVVLDYSLPHMNGLELLAGLEQAGDRLALASAE